jgi:hypothetical protein
MYVCMSICINVYVCTYVCLCVNVYESYLYMYEYTRVCIYIRVCLPVNGVGMAATWKRIEKLDDELEQSRKDQRQVTRTHTHTHARRFTYTDIHAMHV